VTISLILHSFETFNFKLWNFYNIHHYVVIAEWKYLFINTFLFLALHIKKAPKRLKTCNRNDTHIIIESSLSSFAEFWQPDMITALIESRMYIYARNVYCWASSYFVSMTKTNIIIDFGPIKFNQPDCSTFWEVHFLHIICQWYWQQSLVMRATR